MSNTLTYILLLNYVWHTQNYWLECSMWGQFGGYFRFVCGSGHVIPTHLIVLLNFWSCLGITWPEPQLTCFGITWPEPKWTSEIASKLFYSIRCWTFLYMILMYLCKILTKYHEIWKFQWIIYYCERMWCFDIDSLLSGVHNVILKTMRRIWVILA